MSHFTMLILCALFFLMAVTISLRPQQDSELETTGLVFLGESFPDDALLMRSIPWSQPDTTAFCAGEGFAFLRLKFYNLPAVEEGRAFTLLGGGPGQTGLHSPNATGFEGLGYHFAILPEQASESPNPLRDEAYKADFTRIVENGTLVFEIYYRPTDINAWGERYFPGTELALTMMRAGTTERVLHAENNMYNWAIAGIGEGNAAEIVVQF